jgi:hypothetical protein
LRFWAPGTSVTQYTLYVLCGTIDFFRPSARAILSIAITAGRLSGLAIRTLHLELCCHCAESSGFTMRWSVTVLLFFSDEFI